MSQLKTAKSAKAKTAASIKTDAEVMAQIRTAEQTGADIWRLIEMALKHILQKGTAGANGVSANRKIDKAKLSELLKTLPPRQQAVLRLVLAGQNYKQIAAELGIAHSTVKVTVAKLRRSFGSALVPVLRQDKAGQNLNI